MTRAITFLKAFCPAGSSPAFSAITLTTTSEISWTADAEKCKQFVHQCGTDRRYCITKHLPTLKLLRGILCLLAWLLARGLRMDSWFPLALISSPSFFSTVAPWAETAAFPASSPWGMPANLGKSFWVSGCSVNKLKERRWEDLPDGTTSRSSLLSGRLRLFPLQLLTNVNLGFWESCNLK